MRAGTSFEEVCFNDASRPQAYGSVESPCLRRRVAPVGAGDLWLCLDTFLFYLPSCTPDMFDQTKSGRIDVYGFSALWKFIQQWKNLFQQYDRDRSGSISYTELQQGEGRQAETCLSLSKIESEVASLRCSCTTRGHVQHLPTYPSTLTGV